MKTTYSRAEVEKLMDEMWMEAVQVERQCSPTQVLSINGFVVRRYDIIQRLLKSHNHED